MFYITYLNIILTLYSSLTLAERGGTDRPIIGILAQEQDPPGNKSYIPSSYVKAVESAGARVVPIFINESPQYYNKLVSVLNGIVFPGGSANLTATTGFSRSAKIIFDLANQINDNGDHFPLLGVCQGLEKLAILTNNDKDLLRACPGMTNKALPIRFKPGYRRSSLYAKASHRDVAVLSRLNSTANHHEWCVTEKNLTKMGLNKYWRVLTVNRDGENKEFISSMQAYKYPYVGLQFHPEMASFEWLMENNPHSIQAIKANRLFYDWLVHEARQNQHHFNKTSEEGAALIYNYQQVYTGSEGDYDQQYIF